MDQKEKPYTKAVEKCSPLMPEYGQEQRVFDINPNEWTHLCSARFGEARPCLKGGLKSSIQWSGDSHRYDIYECNSVLALRWSNGSGEGWFTARERDNTQTNILRHISQLPSEELRWDLCHALWQTAHKGALASALKRQNEYERAFVDGRLKKKKNRKTGKMEVTVVPEWLIKSEDGKFWNGVQWGEQIDAHRYSQAQMEMDLTKDQTWADPEGIHSWVSTYE